MTSSIWEVFPPDTCVSVFDASSNLFPEHHPQSLSYYPVGCRARLTQVYIMALVFVSCVTLNNDLISLRFNNLVIKVARVLTLQSCDN